MGTAVSTAVDRLRHTASLPNPVDAATMTAIIALVNDQQLTQMLPPLLDDIHGQVAEDHKDYEGPLCLLDVDCGTGHTTLTLASLTRHWRRPVQLEGWDLDQEKLEIAQARCKDIRWEKNMNSSVTFARVNQWGRLQKGLPISPYSRHGYDFVLSSLAMRSMPLDLFFRGIEGLLGRNDVAVVTCVHPDFAVAGPSSARSEDEKGVPREEVRLIHSVNDVLEAAAKFGLVIQRVVKEAKLSIEMVQRLGPGQREAAEEWVGRKVWFGVVLRRVVDGDGP